MKVICSGKDKEWCHRCNHVEPHEVMEVLGQKCSEWGDCDCQGEYEVHKVRCLKVKP
jgi:hypothetical protein